jgi:hypothetical protein
MYIEGVDPIPFGKMSHDAGLELGVPIEVKLITIWYNGNDIYIQIIERNSAGY